MKNWVRALHYFRPDASSIAAVLALLAGSAAASLLKPWPLAILVDSVLGRQPLPAWLGGGNPDAAGSARLVLWLSVATFALHAGQGALSAAQNFLAIRVGLRGLRRVRNEMFACLQRLSLRFHQGSQSGDLIYRASWDTYAFQTLFQHGLLTFLTALLSLTLMAVVMWRLNVNLTLAALATVPLLLVVIRVFGKQMRERGVAAQQADSRVTSLVQQSIAAMPLIQSYTREDHEQQTFGRQAMLAQERRLSQHGWELLYWLAIAVVFALGTAGLLWLGTEQVRANRLTVGQLLIFLAYLAQLYEPLNQLSHVGATVAGASAGTQRVFEILDTPEEVRDAPQARSVRRPTAQPREARNPEPEPLLVHGALHFDHVSFGYSPNQPVLRDVSFTLSPGQSAAIIGPSGAGKTTLLHLLPRFFDPAAGAVRLDGVDLRELRLKELRAHVALVMQEPMLLSATIADNIACGKPGATNAEIEAAARAANADGFIRKLPQQYQTLAGEGAAQLSVGERQRLNLARAFLKDAPVLLLDEPTSALDAESEALVVASLAELKRGRTTLMVAHRLSTIQGVDKILVLHDGRLIEEGSPDELLDRNGYYARTARGRMTD